VNDSTPEQLHEIAKDNPQGLYYFRDELSGWAAELDMPGREGARTMYLSAMTGNHKHNVDRIGREGGKAQMTISMFGSFQPLLFSNFLNETKNVADGMIPRLRYLVWPDLVAMPPIDRAPNVFAKQMYRNVIFRLADLSDSSVHIHFSPEAQQMFYQFQIELQHKIDRETNPGKKSHLSKYEGGLAQIAGLLQLVDVIAALPETPSLSKVDLVSGETSDKQVARPLSEVIVDVEHFQRALDLLGYLESHMRRVYDSQLSGNEYRMSKLTEHIKDGTLHDGVSAREILRKDWVGLSQHVTGTDAIQYALEELTRLGWVRPIPVKPGTGAGRPTVRWAVNPVARTT
jgi:hypothetical protein